jgi:hypothetical protein
MVLPALASSSSKNCLDRQRPPAKLYGGGRYLEFAGKSSPRKKTAIEKKSTVSDREFDSLSDTVEFFDLRIFSSGELLPANCC